MDGTACISMFNSDNKNYNTAYWKKEISKVDSVQSNVRAQIGCGTPIFVEFIAPFDVNDYKTVLDYDFRALGEDEDLIRNDEQRYCLKQCYKISFYVQQLYRFEILRMRAEFAKDIHGTIWFTYASKILVRPGHDPVRENEQRMQRMAEVNEAKKIELENKLREHVEKDQRLGKKELQKK